MFDIKIEGYSMDLDPATQIGLERYNPMMDFTTVQGSRVNSFTLPDTPLNRRVLGYFYDPQTGYKNRKFFCEKCVDSQVIEQGYVKIQEAGENATTLFFTKNLGEIFGDRQTIPLSEIDFPLLTFPNNPASAADPLTSPCCYPSIQNPAFYGNQAFSGIVNKFDGTATYDQAARIPMFFVRWVLEQYGLLTGWTFQGDFLKDPDLVKLILVNLFSLDGQSVLQPANHLPDLTMGGLLLDLRRLFNLFLDFDIRRKVCDIGFSESVLKSDCVIDWTMKAEPVHLKKPETVNRLDLGFEIDGNDGLMKPIPAGFTNYVTPETAANGGGSALQIRSKLSTYLTDPVSGLAKTSQAGISPTNKDNQNKGTPKLLFWKGVIAGVPTATNASGSRSLLWSGPNNLVDTGYKQYERFKGQTFGLQKLVQLTPADMAGFSFKNKVHIKGVNYVVGNMKAILKKNQRVIPAAVELWRC